MNVKAFCTLQIDIHHHVKYSKEKKSQKFLMFEIYKKKINLETNECEHCYDMVFTLQCWSGDGAVA